MSRCVARTFVILLLALRSAILLRMWETSLQSSSSLLWLPQSVLSLCCSSTTGPTTPASTVERRVDCFANKLRLVGAAEFTVDVEVDESALLVYWCFFLSLVDCRRFLEFIFSGFTGRGASSMLGSPTISFCVWRVCGSRHLCSDSLSRCIGSGDCTAVQPDTEKSGSSVGAR